MTRSNNIGYDFIYIKPYFALVECQQFDPNYVKALLKDGYVRGRAGYP
jgi:hypothetical protein